MASKKEKTLRSLRDSISDRQRAILDDVWIHVKATQLGLPERPLMDKFGKEVLLMETAKLGGTLVYSNYEENKNRYNIGLAGIFLTSQGQHLEKAVERYLVALRDAYQKNKDIERFSNKDLAAWAPELTSDDLTSLRHILNKGHGTFASRLSGWNAEEWFIGVDDEVVELKNENNWHAFIEQRVLKSYNPALPSDEAGRSRYLASGQGSSLNWHHGTQPPTIGARITTGISKAWHDPVGSKLISATILSLAGIALLWIGSTLTDTFFGSPKRLQHIVTDEDRAIRNLTIPRCEERRDARKLYEIARDIPSQAAREAEISTLVGVSICSNDEPFALELFTKLMLPAEKDSAARLAAQTHLNAGNYSAAQKWASVLTDPEDKQWWLRQILRETSKKTKDRPST
jgi:hypothetical protein